LELQALTLVALSYVLLSVLNNIYFYIDNCNKYSVAVNGDGSITAEQPNDAVSESTHGMILE